MATSIKNSSWFDHQAGCVYLTRDDTLGLNFHASLGENHSVKFSRYDYVIAFDLTLDSRAFTQDKAMAGKQIALHLGVNAKNPGGFQGALEAHAFVNEAGEFVAFCFLAASL